MIVDCFTFFNEVDILLLRLEELWDIVDKFLIIESGHTFGGKVKPFYLERYAEYLEPYKSKIEIIRLRGLPPLLEDTENDRFRLEIFQRNMIVYGLVQLGAVASDVILISDVDEIPSNQAITQAVGLLDTVKAVGFKQHLYKRYFDLNRGMAERQPWVGTVAANFAQLCVNSPQELRRGVVKSGEYYIASKHDKHNPDNIVLIGDAGWHLTYFGGDKAVDYKLSSFAHGSFYVDRLSTEALPVFGLDRHAFRIFDAQLEADIEHMMNNVLRGQLPRTVLANPVRFFQYFATSLLRRPGDLATRESEGFDRQKMELAGANN